MDRLFDEYNPDKNGTLKGEEAMNYCKGLLADIGVSENLIK